MGLNIKNPATEAAIRKLATLRGVSLTEAIDQAVRKDLAEETSTKAARIKEKLRAIQEIVDHFASLPRLDPRPLAQIMDDMYDEQGLPV